MKKIIVCLLTIFTLMSPMHTQRAKAENETPAIEVEARSAILIEPLSGKVIFEKNADEQHFPASMTKMMGMYLVLNAIENGKIKWTDMVTASPYACSMGGTQIFLEPGEQMSVEDMFKAVSINSANDAITALGEHLSGSTPAFVKYMNDTAKKLGMQNTLFKNPTGFDDAEHVTTARDMATIASNLITFGEDLFRFTRLKEAYVRTDSENPFWLVNTNKMLGAYQGLDGLKTGYTNKAGYNLTATAYRNGVRVISVVMNEQDIKTRSKDMTTLLNYGFSALQAMELFQANVVIASYDFNHSMEKATGLVLHEPAKVVVGKDVKKEDIETYIELDTIDAPIEDNQVVGQLVIKIGEQIFTYDIYTKNVVKKASFLDYLWSYILQLLS